MINTPCRLHQSIVTLNNAYRKHALARICWSSIYIDLLLYTEMLDLFLLGLDLKGLSDPPSLS